MDSPFSTTRRVAFRDTDAAGIMHFSVFFTWMEDAEHELLRHRGLSVSTRDSEGVISWPRVAAQCDFKSPLKFEDEVTIIVQLSRLGEKSATYTFQFMHQEREVAVGSLTAVCCRLPSDGAPFSIPIPEAIDKKLRSLLQA